MEEADFNYHRSKYLEAIVVEEMKSPLEDEDLEIVDSVARKTIMQMRNSNMLIQFPQDEFQPPSMRVSNKLQSIGKVSDMIVKRPLQLEEEEYQMEVQEVEEMKQATHYGESR